MKRATAQALARRIEQSSDRYTAVPFVLHKFQGGPNVWSVKCTDQWTGYSFDVCSPERWEYLSTPPRWDSDGLWKQILAEWEKLAEWEET